MTKTKTTPDAAPPLVVGIGEILWDMLPTGRRIGGAPTNFAYHVNALGVPATVVSGVGDDALGDKIRAQVAAWGMSPQYLAVRPDFPTGTVQVEVDALGSPRYVIEENVAWDHPLWNDPLDALAKSVRAVCFGTLSQRHPESRAAIRKFVEATAPGCIRLCDINLRQHFFDDDLLRDCLQRATVLKLNEEELPIVAAAVGLSGSENALLSALREKFDLDLIALTRGSAGSVLLTRAQISERPGLPVKVMDTVGAGDAFTAALTVGLLHGDDLDAINDAAQETAAAVCRHAGAIPGVEGEKAT